MFVDNRRCISEKYTRDDYIKLNLGLSSSTYIWNKAIEMMRDRIIGRFLNPMDVLIKSDVNRNGFAAMALCSLLIETLYQFREGKASTPKNNDVHYANFLKTQMGDIFTPQFAKRFYSDIRCAILHSAQTKKGSCLTFDTDYVVKVIGSGENSVFMVNVPKMFDAVVQYFDGYCMDLKNVSNIELRENFIKKMNDITKKLEGTEAVDNVWFAICAMEDMIIERPKGKEFHFNVVQDGQALKINNSNIRLFKKEIEEALYVWPDVNEIQECNPKNAKFIIPLLCRCRNIVDETLRREIA